MRYKLFIVGAAKSGTTSLANWISRHPSFYLPNNKEPKYFTDFNRKKWVGPGIDGFLDTLVTDDHEYDALYDVGSSSDWGIDASTDYLWCPESAKLIKQSFSETPGKLIISLRDPVERAISEYRHTIRDNMETKGFRRSLELEEGRVARNYHPLFYHSLRGCYVDQVGRYLEIFDRSQIFLVEFEELRQPAVLMKRVFEFLGVADLQTIKAGVENVSFRRRSASINRLINTESCLKKGARGILPARVRKKLYSIADSMNKGKVKVPTDEIVYAKDMFRNEINRCRSELPIDTRAWGSI